MIRKLFIAFCLIVSFAFSVRAFAQMVYMPDSILRQRLSFLGFGSCIVGDSIDPTCTTIPNLKNFDFSDYGIHSLEGLEVFTSLTKLYCKNQLQSNLKILEFPPSLDTLILIECSIDSLPQLPSGLLYLVIQYNDLTVLPNMPVALKVLTCSFNSLQSLPQLSDSLIYLDCSFNQLTTLPSPLPQGLIELYCYDNDIYTLPPLPPFLEKLNVGQNQLTYIAAVPNSLKYFNCIWNQVSSLPAFPNSMLYLYCGANQISYLPTLPDSLIYLECSRNLLTTIPSLPNSLEELSVSENQITFLPLLPSTLRTLYCRDNQIAALPYLPNSISSLNISNNPISSLPFNLPTSLFYFFCEGTQITSLPPLPFGLYRFTCNRNQLTVIPALPPTLVSFDCSSTQITSLPSLPNSLKSIGCDSTLISSLPELPDSLGNLHIIGNSNLNCLPPLKKIYYFDFSGTPIDCLPNYGQISISNPDVNSLPLCNVFNINGCDFNWNISGKVFDDRYYNCVQSITEQSLKNVPFKLYKDSILIQQAITNSNGKYSFDTDDLDTFLVVLDTAGLPFTSNCPAGIAYTEILTATDSTRLNDDFALQCNGVDVGVWSVVSQVFRPAHLSKVQALAGDLAARYGTHCAVGRSGTVTVVISGPAHYYSYASGSLPPSSVIGNVITYHISDFYNLDPATGISFLLETDTTAMAGSTICIDIDVGLLPDDVDSTNNTLSQCFIVRASFDPNDKEVYPAGIIDTSQRELTYTIRFQNTGNAPADNIYILDTLDSNLDASTFELLSVSHDAFVQVLPGNVLKFNFPLINLPDSFSNEPLSHGYVQYKIGIKEGLPLGTQIRNSAAIYFDFNAPVITNTTSNTIDITASLPRVQQSRYLNVFPSPFSDEIIVEGEYSGCMYQLSNVFGQVVSEGRLFGRRHTVRTGEWSEGIYFLRIEGNSGSVVRKLIKKQ